MAAAEDHQSGSLNGASGAGAVAREAMSRERRVSRMALLMRVLGSDRGGVGTERRRGKRYSCRAEWRAAATEGGDAAVR